MNVKIGRATPSFDDTALQLFARDPPADVDTFRDLLTNIYGEKDGKLKWIEYGKPFLQLMSKAAK